jgi:hypothetical protein
MNYIPRIGLIVFAMLVLAGIATASASAELPEYMTCSKTAKVGKAYVGHYTSALCTEESKVETGGEYELEKGFGKKAAFTVKSGKSVMSSPEVEERIDCKSTATTGEFTGSKQMKNVVMTASGCEANGSRCTTAGAKTGHIVTNPLKGEFGYIAGKGTIAPTVGLLLSEESTEYAAEFACEGIEIRTEGPIIGEASGNINSIAAEATYTFRQAGGVQQYTSFEGGGMFEDEWHWEFDIGRGFEPEGGDRSGLEVTGVTSQGAFEVKA